MIHAAMGPVLNVEGCRTLLVSIVVHHRQPCSLVSMSLWLSTCPGCGGYAHGTVQYSTVQYSTVDRDQLRKVTLRDDINSVL